MTDIIQNITKKVRMTPDEYDFTDTMGSFINNREFSEGYLKYKSGIEDKQTFIWNVLSAISEDTSEVLYENIRHYIDLVSNVDICKTKSLNSMIKNINYDCNIIECVQLFPLEIINLIDIFSINKKYLLDNDKIKQDLIDDIFLSCGVSQKIDSKEYYKNFSNDFGFKNDENEYTLTLLSDYAYDSFDKSLNGLLREYGCCNIKIQKIINSNNESYYRLLIDNNQKFIIDSDTFENKINPECGFCDISGYGIKYIGNRQGIVDDHISDDKYMEYIKNVFKDLIYSFLNLKYNSSAIETKPIFNYIKNEYQLNEQYYDTIYNSDFNEFKKNHNINSSFDEKGIVDQIDNGLDSLDNYSGYEKQLLNLEIQKRAEKLSFNDIGDYRSGYIGENKTRYSYYRKAKVLEYARFVDNKFAIDNLYNNGENYNIYDINTNYFNITPLLSNVFDYDKTPVINDQMVNQVSESLAKITVYIQQIRNKIKIQTRKNYMKGTNNLLIYIINEFLVDYANYNNIFNDHSQQLGQIKDTLISSDSKDIEVVEYYDNTEYYNLKTSRSEDAKFQDFNPPFMDDYFIKDGNGNYNEKYLDGQEFTFNELKEFYLSSLNLQETIGSNDVNKFLDFLSVIYNGGMLGSYIGKNGLIHTKVSSDQNHELYTEDLYNSYVQISTTFDGYKMFLSAGDYQYPEKTTVQDQLSNVQYEYMYNKLSSEYLSAISDVYNNHIQDYNVLTTDFYSLYNKYEDTLSGEFNHYFIKCEGKRSLEYNHDYYIGNIGKYNSTYLIDKFGDFKNFIEEDDNIVNHDIIDILTYVETDFKNISSDMMENVESYCETIGYIDIKATEIDKELDSLDGFLDDKIEDRKNEIERIWESIKTQVDNLKTAYDRIDNTTNATIASYDDPSGSQQPIGGSCRRLFGLCQNKTECSHTKWKKCTIPYTNQKNILQRLVDSEKISQYKLEYGYLLSEKETDESKLKKYLFYWTDAADFKGKYDDINESESGSGDCSITESDSIETKISKMAEWMGQTTNGIWTTPKDEEGSEIEGNCVFEPGSEKYGYCDPGALESLHSIKADIEDLKNTFNVIVKEIEDIGGKFSDSSIGIKNKIDNLLKYVGTQTDISVNNEAIIKKYKEYKDKIIVLRTRYNTLKEEYDTLSEKTSNYNSKLTIETINNLRTATIKEDAEAKINLLGIVNGFIEQYYSIQNTYTTYAYKLVKDLPSFVVKSDYLEIEMDDLYKTLIKSIDDRYEEGIEKMQPIMDTFESYIDILKMYIVDDLSSTENNFEYYINKKIESLNFFEWDSYLSSVEIFKTYGGNNNCYVPYYNYKNTTHPTYQIHPFLWNFVEATNIKDVVSRSFNSMYNEKLEYGNIKHTIDNIIGEFGQIINIWENNTTDWSGYTTRFEINSHEDTGVEKSPINDYDGGFYPPAVEEYVKNKNIAANTVYNRYTQNTLVNKIIDNLHVKTLSSYNVDSMTQIIDKEIDGCYIDYSSRSIVEEYDKQYHFYLNPSINSFRQFFNTRLPETFYQKYYYHLNIDDENNHTRKFIANQLSNDEIFERISDIVERKEKKSDVYDIYRYGLDFENNMFILYKKYKQEDPSFKEKRNTLGEIWLRLKNNPISFPGIMSYDNRKLQQFYNYQDMNIYLLSSVYNEQTTDFDYRHYCYDFDFSNDKNIVSMVCRNTEISDDVYKTYEYPYIVMSQINDEYDKIEEKRNLIKLTNNNGQFDDIIYSDETTPKISDISVQVEGQHDFITKSYIQYIGQHSPNNKNIRLVYVKTNHHILPNQELLEDLSGDVLSIGIDNNPMIYVALFNEKTSQVMISGNYMTSTQLNTNNQEVDSHEIAYVYNNEDGIEQMIFAIPTKIYDKNVYTSYQKNKSIDLDDNTEGAPIDDPTSIEMNSHDIFDENITLIKTRINDNTIIDNGNQQYNLNSDIAYQPVYPGYDRQYTVKTTTYKDYDTVELLGRSKNIDKIVDNINPTPNPYFSIDDILSNRLFGRVYENYVSDIDKTLVIRDNDVFGENLPHNKSDHEPIEQDGYKLFNWQIQLSSIDVSDIAKTNIVIYNVKSIGKNPYFITTLNNILSTEKEPWKYGYYNDLTNQYETEISGQNGGQFTVVGTQKQGTTNYLDINRFNNIQSIRAHYEPENKYLTIQFIYDKKEKNTYISEGTVKVVVYNDKNIDIFQYYHMLDAYGSFNAYEMYKNGSLFDKVVRGSGWTIRYPATFDEDLKTRARSFIESDGQREYLENIQLSDYSFLSDVYVYNKDMLAFKYNEENIFPRKDDNNYYYPFLNNRYPMTAAQYFVKNNSFVIKDNEQLVQLDNIFNEGNLFIMNLEESENIIDKLGKIEIPLIDSYDEQPIRVYEDFLSTYSYEIGQGEDVDIISGYNKDRYDVNDPRIFEFVHFCELSNINKTEQEYEELIVPEDFYTHRTNDEFCTSVLNYFMDKDYIPMKPTMAYTTDSEYVTVTPNLSNSNIENLLKIQTNYKKEENGTITLYFNYSNFLNSPFISYEDGNLKSALIEGSYLKLNANENGKLDIYLQVRYYSSGQLFGYRNIKILSYQIYNISDDKPKLIIKKMYQIDKDTLTGSISKPSGKLYVQSHVFDIQKIKSEGYPGDKKYPFTVNVDITSNKKIGVGSTFIFNYPNYMMEFVKQYGYQGYVCEEINDGLIKVTILSKSLSYVKFNFTTITALDHMVEYANRKYGMEIYETDFYDTYNNSYEPETVIGTIEFINQNTYTLTTEGDELEKQSPVVDGNNNMIYAHYIRNYYEQ